MTDSLTRKLDRLKTPSFLFSLLLVSSLIALFLSFSAQFIFNLQPCRLCYLQRISFMALLIFSIFGLTTRFKKTALKLSQLSLFIGIGLAIYHLLIQFGFIADPCPILPKVRNSDAFLSHLVTPIIHCSKISWSILGLPISAFNALYEILLLTFSFCVGKILFKKTAKALSDAETGKNLTKQNSVDALFKDLGI